MARIRKIPKRPPKAERNYFVTDASFLVNKYLPLSTAANPGVEHQIREAHKWWHEIDRQVEAQRARVYVPDLCIAESFKVLARVYYDKGFDKAKKYNHNKAKYRYNLAKKRLSADVSMTHRALQKQSRYIGYHDVPASRDIIVAVGRFYEAFMKNGCTVSVIDMIVVSTAKYLMDFHDASKKQLHIVTHDGGLWRGTKKVTELPNAYDPAEPTDEFSRVFKSK